MPARRRRRAGDRPTAGPVPAPAGRADRRAAEEEAARLFAERRAALEAEEAERARVHREAAAREQRRRDLLRAKEEAAERLKEVRRRGGSAEERAEADAAYRAALDAVLRDEQGLPPADADGAEPEVG